MFVDVVGTMARAGKLLVAAAFLVDMKVSRVLMTVEIMMVSCNGQFKAIKGSPEVASCRMLKFLLEEGLEYAGLDN
jgi:hypothetical protein